MRDPGRAGRGSMIIFAIGSMRNTRWTAWGAQTAVPVDRIGVFVDPTSQRRMRVYADARTGEPSTSPRADAKD